MVHNKQILLVMRTGLEGPVEGASQQKHVINKHELVVHVVLLIIISTGWNTKVSQGLAIVTLVGHGFVISDDSDIDSLLLHVFNSVCKGVVRQVKHTNQELLLGHFDVALELIDVIAVREEECIHVAGLWTVKIILNSGNVLTKIIENFLIILVGHLGGSNLEKGVYGLLDSVTVVATWHLGKNTGESARVLLSGTHVVTVLEILSDFVVRALDSSRFLWTGFNHTSS